MIDERTIYPSHSGIITFLRAPYKKFEDLKSGDIAIIGAPYDTTLGSRPGAKFAPKSIREQTIHSIYHFGAIDKETINITTKKRTKFPPKDIIVDLGDARVYPSNVEKTTESVANCASKIVEAGALLVGLGGDHYVTYPLVKGFEAGLKKLYGENIKLGYIHLDAHLDAYDENDTWGKFYHGSFARRVSELSSFNLSNMVWVGINGNVGVEPYEYITNSGGTILTLDDIRERGIEAVINEAIDIASKDVVAVYVTIDIDLVDQIYAPGTGSASFDGITAKELLNASSALTKCEKIRGIDIVEVAPNLDPIGNTSKLAANTILEFLSPLIYE